MPNPSFRVVVGVKTGEHTGWARPASSRVLKAWGCSDSPWTCLFISRGWRETPLACLLPLLPDNLTFGFNASCPIFPWRGRQIGTELLKLAHRNRGALSSHKCKFQAQENPGASVMASTFLNSAVSVVQRNAHHLSSGPGRERILP